MKRLIPDTLLTRSILIVVAALVVAQLIAILSFKFIAENVFASMHRTAQAEAALSILDLAGQHTDAETFAEAVSAQSNVVSVRRDARAFAAENDAIGAEVQRRRKNGSTPGSAVEEFRVSGARPGGPPMGGRPDAAIGPPGDRPPADWREPRGTPGKTGMPPIWIGPAPFAQGEGDAQRFFRFITISVRYGEADWVNVVMGASPDRGPPLQPFIFVLSLSLIAVGVAAALASRWLYRPLNDLTLAAISLGEGGKHSPLPLSGPRDVRKVMQAFNTMAARLEATLQSQKDVLVAIGHDLRTPLTAMRIRAAMIEDTAERDKMERALDELQSLTEAALQAGTSALRADEKLVTDLGALVESLAEDLTDLGMPVSCEEPDGQMLVRAWPEDLTRALRNIIVNAVRYGTCARIRLERQGESCAVIIEDDGPGIPEADMEAVFDPLVRLEKSRNSGTGGHGLGLHISRNIVRAHNGQIELENLPEGGFRARVILPLSGA